MLKNEDHTGSIVFILFDHKKKMFNIFFALIEFTFCKILFERNMKSSTFLSKLKTLLEKHMFPNYN
jgi:hypothetical protein